MVLAIPLFLGYEKLIDFLFIASMDSFVYFKEYL